jgi:hypothetical protein
MYEDVTYNEYDSWDAVRPTVIKELQKDACMELCKHKIDNPRPPGPSLVVGNAVHTLAMEPELFGSKYVYVPKTYENPNNDPPTTKWNWGAKVCKAWGAEQEAAGKTIIRKAAQQFPRPKEAVEGMAGAITGHPLAGRLLSGGMCEVCIVWVDNSSGVLCKTRLDYIRPGKGGGEIIVDIKTAIDVSADAICRSFYNFGYQIQAAMGWDALEAIGKQPERYLYVAVRNKKPYMVNVVEAEEPVLEMGRGQYKWFVKEWGKCLETGVYPGYNATGVTTLMLPGWAGQEF